MLTAILIDPVAKTVEAIQHSGEYDDIRATLGCKWIEAVDIGGDYHIYVDEEFLLKDEPGPFFQIDKGNPLGGRGIIFSTTPDGDEASALVSPDLIRAYVTFPDIRFTGFKNYEGEGLLFGERVPVFGQRATYEKVGEDE